MSDQLSAVFDVMNKRAWQQPNTPRGVAQGTRGSVGSVPFRGRNSDAGVNKERQQMMQGPIYKALMAKAGAYSPVTQYLESRNAE